MRMWLQLPGLVPRGLPDPEMMGRLRGGGAGNEEMGAGEVLSLEIGAV